MNNYLKIGIPVAMMAIGGAFASCNNKKDAADLDQPTRMEMNVNYEMPSTKELLEEAKTLAEPFKSQEFVEQHIKEKYGSFENFNKERQALGIDPSLGTYQAMLKVDSAKVAPLYQKYGVEQPATDAPFSEKANAFLEVFGRESDEIIEKQQKILNDLYKTIRIINPQKDTIDTSQKNLTNNYPLVEPFKFPIN